MSEQQAIPQNLTREQFEAVISAKGWQDESFLAELRRDPKGTLEKMQGITLPANIEVRLVEETANVIYLRLPANPAELSDEMLDQVAGGGWGGSEISIGNRLTQPQFAAIIASLKFPY